MKAAVTGTLILGAASTLSACDPNNATASSGGSQTATTQAGGSSTGAGSGGATTSSGSQTGSSTGSGSSGSRSGSGGGSGACATGSLGVKMTGETAGMGHRGVVLVFTNNGSSTCTVTGYPGATVTEDGRSNFAPRMNAQRVPSGYVGGATVSTVTLAPGATASALMEWESNPTNGADPSAANCPGMGGGYLEITPPNTTAYTKSDPPADMCADLEVHPVVKGSSGGQ